MLIPLAGCKSKDEIKVYRVPKQTAKAPEKSADPHAGLPMANSDGSDPHAGIPMPTPGSPDPHAGLSMPRPPGVDGEVPETWKPGRGSSMRLASYLVEGEEGAVADISLIVLGGGAGGVLDNVNRWRGQIGLEPVDEAGLAASSQKIATPQGEAVVVDLEADEPAADPAKDGRILAAILPLENVVWFYKMRGNPSLVGREKDAFLRWVETARRAKEPTAPTDGNPSAVESPSPSPDTDREVTWNVPEGWKELPAKSMRVATFSISGEDDSTAEVSVVELGGSGGGELANVNRWREQIGLDQITAEQLAAAVTLVEAPAGSLSVVDCSGTEARTIAAWIARDKSTWFFKLNGPPALVEAEKEHFEAFLSSVDFPEK